MGAVIKHPTAWIPFALTLVLLVVFGLYFAGIISPDPAGDEGTVAHMFQIWFVLEVCSVMVFALRWFATKSREMLMILGLQIALALVPLFIVFSLHL